MRINFRVRWGAEGLGGGGGGGVGIGAVLRDIKLHFLRDNHI